MTRNGSTLLIVLVIVAVVIAIGSILVISFVTCGQRERQISIPQFLQGAQIKFEDQMYYQVGNQQEETPTFTAIGREIVSDTSLGSYYHGRFQYEPVSTSTLFTVVGAVNNANCGLSSVDSGPSGVDFLIVQDDKGTKSLVATVELIANDRGVSYYRDGKKIGYVESTDFSN